MLALLVAMAVTTPTISKAQVRPTYDGAQMSAAYMIIRSEAPDRLLEARCDCADSVESHQTVIKNGVARMEGPAPVDLPAHSAVEFVPGGRHLMLMGLRRPLVAGQTIKITLKFEKAGARAVTFRIMGADTGHMSGMSHSSH